MAISIKHAFASAKGDGSDATFVQPSHWNQLHATSMAAGNLVGRLSAGAGVFEEIPISAYMAGLLATADYNALAAKLGLFSPGDLKFSMSAAPAAGWILYQASWTLAKAGSGATYAGDIYWPLFAIMWTHIDQAYAPVSGGKGGTAQADWDAGKNITLPQFGGRAINSAGSTPGASSRPNGHYGGAESVVLTPGQMPSHRHPCALSEPAHAHTASTNALRLLNPGTGGSAYYGGNQAVPVGSVTVDAVTTGMRVWASDYGYDATYLAGGDQAHSIMQPIITMWLHIKL